MAQHDDYIADRVWSDMDMDLRQRAAAAANATAPASAAAASVSWTPTPPPTSLPQVKPDPNALSNVTAATVSWTPSHATTSLPLHHLKSSPDPTSLTSVAVSSGHLPPTSHQQLSTSSATHTQYATTQTTMYPNYPTSTANANAGLQHHSVDVNSARNFHHASNSVTNSNNNHNTTTSNANTATISNVTHSQLPLSSTTRHHQENAYLTPLQGYPSLGHAAAVSASITSAPSKPPSGELPRWNRPPLHPHNHLGHHPAHQPSPYHPASMATNQYPSAYPPYGSFPPTDASSAAAARSTELMERALRDVSTTTNGASVPAVVSSSDSLLHHQRTTPNGPGPIVTPLTDADRHPGPVIPTDHALGAFSMHHPSQAHVGHHSPDTIATAASSSTTIPRSPITGAPIGVIGKTKQRRRYAKPKSSRYCHLCARHERAVKMFPCGNVELGICQKSVCLKCFEMYGLDLNAARLPRLPATPRWTCPHCQNSCPKKAKCHSYDRQTERRRMKTRELKRQLKLKVQACREAYSAS